MSRTLTAAGLAVAVLGVAAATAPAQDADPRSRAARETREALEAYRQVLEDELRRLKEWFDRATDPETRDRLRRAREEAERQLDRLTDEAAKAWESIRSRMDVVVDDVRREHRRQAPQSERAPSRP